MKKKILIFIAAIVICVACFGSGMILGAGTAEPGSQGDPLVTLSYLNSRLAELGQGSAASSYKQVKLTSGQKLTLSDGSELIVYSGNASVTGTAGLMSLTGGEMFPEGTSTVLYNLYMGIGDNSGIKAGGSMTVYVKGGYSVK